METVEQINQELLAAAKAFVRWVDACWGATEVLAPKTLSEYESAKQAIESAEAVGRALRRKP